MSRGTHGLMGKPSTLDSTSKRLEGRNTNSVARKMWANMAAWLPAILAGAWIVTPVAAEAQSTFHLGGPHPTASWTAAREGDACVLLQEPLAGKQVGFSVSSGESFILFFDPNLPPMALVGAWTVSYPVGDFVHSEIAMRGGWDTTPPGLVIEEGDSVVTFAISRSDRRRLIEGIDLKLYAHHRNGETSDPHSERTLYDERFYKPVGSEAMAQFENCLRETNQFY